MKTKLVKIGNSRGIRLPKAVIEQAGLRDDEVELVVRDGEVVLRSPPPLKSRRKNPRAGWAKAFDAALAKLPANHLERERQEFADWQNMPNDFDDKGWTW